MFMVQVEYLALILTGIGIIVSILYYASVLRNANKTQQMQLETRQAQLFINIFNVYASKQFQKDREKLMQLMEWTNYDDFFAKYGPDVDPEAHAIWDSTATWLEGLGVLVKRGLIDSELVYDIMYGFIINFWERHLPLFTRFREQWNPYLFEDLESLYDHMKHLSEKHGKEARAVFTSRYDT
jgi:hypothetical protein